MFTAILAFLFVGATEPTLFARPDTDKPFVGISACQEWAAEELGRIGSVLATMPKDKRPGYSISCVPVGPLVDG